jgi:hypothetical protein
MQVEAHAEVLCRRRRAVHATASVWYMIVVPRQVPTSALVVHRSAEFIYVGAQVAARGGRCSLCVADT